MYSQKSKKETRTLIQAVKNGDQGAFNRLLMQYAPLIEASVNMFCSDSSLSREREDFRQEAHVAFYGAILSYNLEQTNVELGLYAKTCILNALISLVRSRKNIPLDPCEDSEHILSADNSSDPSVGILEEERLKNLLHIIKKTLSQYEYTIWEMYFSGKSVSEIAINLNVEPKSIHNAIYRIRVKLKNALNSERIE